jgi:hypothetical protein
MADKDKHYPLLFEFSDLLEGNGFVAAVHANCRALAREEDGGWWIDGVNPGAMAEGGRTIHEAHLFLLQCFRKVLLDFAKSAADFDAFRTATVDFFNQTDEESLLEWDEAVGAVRAGERTIEGLVRIPSAQRPAKIDVVLRVRHVPSSGRIDDDPLMAA